ncbi:ATP-binding protein [Aestuariivirga sp.]|uniref:ATP-binding protein n=1 Tax=Aestuariivirga sp. TaxID=2650926 RepID=UPI003919A3DC
MTPDLVQSREAVNRAGRATWLLLAASVVLLTALGIIFTQLSLRQNALQQGGGERALYAVHQLDRDARLLVRALESSSGAENPAAQHSAFEQRMAALSQEAGFSLGADGVFAQKLDVIRALSHEVAPLLGPPGRGSEDDRQQVPLAALKAANLVVLTEGLMSYTHERLTATHAAARDGVAQLQNISVFVVAVLAATIGFLLFNLMQQVRTVRKAATVLENTAEAMSVAYEAAEAGNRAKSEFMATIGHEIRTPLNAILGMAELLTHSPLGAEERRHVDVITSSGTALLEMLNEILDFAKIEHGRMTSETVNFDARLLASDAVRIVEGRARERQNRLELLADDLPQPGWYLSDPTLIRRVLLNLLSNAVKFTEKGLVLVRVQEARGGAMLRFEITDTGIGIPEDARQRLFNAFSQVDSTISRRFGGTGLGLVICKRIVEMLGGSIGVESSPGLGSKFWFEVPATRSDPSAVPASSAQDAPATLPRLTILVVEDHPINRQVAEKFLLMLGQSVVLASDGAEGVTAARSGRFDLILMDMQMPVMDGIAATRAIREAGSRARIVAMTANASDDDRRRCIAAGMDGFEPKPITLKRLAALIGSMNAACPAPAAFLPSHPLAGDAAVPEVWDEERLTELVYAVGEDGLKDLLRLFRADVPILLEQLNQAVCRRDAEAIDQALHALKGAAANLGLSGVASLAQALRHAEIDSSVPGRLAAEIARIDVIPQFRKAA